MMRNTGALLYLLPAFLMLGLFAYWPLASAFRLALYESDGLGYSRFTGVQHFAEIAKDPLFWKGFAIIGLFALGLPLQVFGPFLGAKLIHLLASRRAAFFYRTVLVIPVVVPMMTGVLIWRNFYSPEGAVNRLLAAVGLPELATTWLGNTYTVIPAVIFMGVPWMGGIPMLLYLAGFINIPKNLYEAALLDGASQWDILRCIEMPLLATQFRLVTILACLALIQSYENILVLTNGGPGNATLVPALYLFKNGFEYGRLGYASALGFILFVLSLMLTLTSMGLIRKRGF
jgi:raffinose/stachyose/melibiose transport system permease protein